VVQVSSGQEALDWVKGHPGEAELVLLDLVMPGMDGEETYHALREREAGLPILITSGYAQGDVTERLMGAGACGMVYKPYKSEKLVAEIRRTIDEVAKGSQP
jgi:CheY-like chemotaxis protein